MGVIRSLKNLGWIFAVGAFSGFYCFNSEFLVCPADNICSLAGETIELSGKIVSWPSQRLEKTFLEVEAEASSGGKSGRILLILSHANYRFQYLEKIKFRGKIKRPEAEDHKNFSYPLFLAGKNIFVIMQDPEILSQAFEEREMSFREKILSVLARWRERMRSWIDGAVREPEAAVVKAMVLGDQGEIPDSVRTPLSRSGLIHILSISGSHVTFLILVFSTIFARLGLRPLFSLLLNLAFIAFYLLLSGAPACAERAGLMGLAALFFTHFGFLPHPSFIFWFSFVILVWQNPLAPLADIGFQLSYLAVFSMLFVFPPVHKIFFWGHSGKLANLGSAILFGVVVSAFTTPLAAFYFGNLPWIAPLANLLLAPLISLFLPWGMIFLGLNFIGALTGLPIGWLNILMTYPLHWFWRLIVLANDYLLKIPNAFSEKEFSVQTLFGLYFLVAVSAVALRKYLFSRLIKLKIKKFSEPIYWERRQERRKAVHFRFEKILSWPPLSFLGQNKIFVLYFLIITVVALFSLLYFWERSRPPNLFALDVGQGDALLINFPGQRLQILIDGGPGRSILSALDQEMPFFDRQIEFAVLTHYHQDHLEGLIAVLEKYRVKHLIVPCLKSGLPPSLERIFWERVANTPGLDILLARRGQLLSFSDAKKNKFLELKVLAPLFDYSQSKIIDSNDESVVLKMTLPQEILFMGDATLRTEKILRQRMPSELKAEVLKIGHHGSRFSTGEEFLMLVSPKRAVLSVGQKNMYGHPTKEILQRLNSHSIEVERTDLLGTVKLRL